MIEFNTHKMDCYDLFYHGYDSILGEGETGVSDDSEGCDEQERRDYYSAWFTYLDKFENEQ